MLARLAAYSAVFGTLVITALTVIGGAVTPGYSHVSQFISELGATGAPHEYVVRFAGFLPAGLALLVYCWAAYICLPRSRSTTLGLIGVANFVLGYVIAAFFPCDPGCRSVDSGVSQTIHNISAVLGYLLIPLSLVTLARSARTWPRAKLVSRMGIVAACVATAGVVTLHQESPFVGLSQRAVEASVFVWIVACGLYIRSVGGTVSGAASRSPGSVPL